MSVKSVRNAESNKVGAQPAAQSANAADLQQQFSDLLDKIAVQVSSDEWLSQFRDQPAATRAIPKVEKAPEILRVRAESKSERPKVVREQSQNPESTHSQEAATRVEATAAQPVVAPKEDETAHQESDAPSTEATEVVSTSETEVVVSEQLPTEIAAAQLVDVEKQVAKDDVAQVEIDPQELETVVLEQGKFEDNAEPTPADEQAPVVIEEQVAVPELAKAQTDTVAKAAPAIASEAAKQIESEKSVQVDEQSDVAQEISTVLAQKLTQIDEKAPVLERENPVAGLGNRVAPTAVAPVIQGFGDFQSIDMQIALKVAVPSSPSILEGASRVKGLDGVKSVSPQMNQPNSANMMAARNLEKQVSEEPQKAQRMLTKQESTRTLEKVQQVLKEVSKSKDGKTISVRLDPPSLGTLKVDVSFRDNHLHARIVAEAPQVGLLLREKAHELQNILRSSGIEADSISVSIGSDETVNSGMADSSAFQNFESRGWELNSTGTTPIMSQMGMAKGEASIVEDHWVA